MQKRAERVVTISGKNGYVQLTPNERKAFRIEIYFSASNVGNNNSFSFEWYKKRSVYGRAKISVGEYTIREKIIQYQNELLYSEEATLFEITKQLQCERLRQHENASYITYLLAGISEHFQIPIDFSYNGRSFELPTPTPIAVPGLMVEGFYYNMLPGCAGTLTFQTWYDEDECLSATGQPMTRDNRGKPPEPENAGNPPSGTDADVPPPTYPPDKTYDDPTPGDDEPTDEIENPQSSTGIACTLYRLLYDEASSNPANPPNRGQATLYGEYTPFFNRSQNPDVMDYGCFHGISCAAIGANPLWFQLVGGATASAQLLKDRITIVSILPQ